MADRIPSTPLTREVLPPQKPSSGLGIMMVASMAMLFAVASSAFMLRARVARSYCTTSEPRVMMPEPMVLDWLETPHECGTAVYRSNPDGSVSVYFDVCPESQIIMPALRSAPVPEPMPMPALEVRTIRSAID